MINRGRDGMVNAGAVSEGCSRECQWFVVCRSNTRRRADSTDTAFQGHTTPEICFTWCARPKLGLRAGPATPHRNRAYGHETSPQRGCCSPVAREVPRPAASTDGRKRKALRIRQRGRGGRVGPGVGAEC